MASGTMIALWVVTTVSCLTAILLWRRTRRLAAQLDQLSHRYWELKYEQQELRGELQRANGVTSTSPSTGPRPPRTGDAFVPLASLKR
jgi:hypothetical protein